MIDQTFPMFNDLPAMTAPKVKRKKSFSRLIKKSLKRKGVGPVDLQKATGIPWSTLGTWLADDELRPIVNENLKRAVVFLDITLDELMETV
jgi:predicted transcriptional regulator